MLPGQYDFSVVRGDAAMSREQSPLVLRFSLFDAPLVFENVILSVYTKSDELKGTLLFRTDILAGVLVLTDEYSSEVAWYATAEQTRALKVGAKNHYEVEVRYNGNEVVYLLGTITGIGGLNSDAEV
jgi:hypothetical protein